MSSVWDDYIRSSEVNGLTKRETFLRREKRFLNNKLKHSLSYHKIIIEGEEQDLAVINSDNLNEKTLCSLPDEDIILGGLVEWMDEHWLVTERDANSEVYTKAKMLQCNYLLKWVDDENIIHEQWCVVEDGTKLKKFSFRVVKAACKNNLSNCWKILKSFVPQRNIEIYRRDGYESRKKQMDGIWLNPKYFLMDNQQPSSEQEKVQRRSRSGNKHASGWRAKVVGTLWGEDIVCALVKVRGCLNIGRCSEPELCKC